MGDLNIETEFQKLPTQCLDIKLFYNLWIYQDSET